jgi:hypothetical protein
MWTSLRWAAMRISFEPLTAGNGGLHELDDSSKAWAPLIPYAVRLVGSLLHADMYVVPPQRRAMVSVRSKEHGHSHHHSAETMANFAGWCRHLTSYHDDRTSVDSKENSRCSSAGFLSSCHDVQPTRNPEFDQRRPAIPSKRRPTAIAHNSLSERRHPCSIFP